MSEEKTASRCSWKPFEAIEGPAHKLDSIIGNDWFNWYNWFCVSSGRTLSMDHKIVEVVPPGPVDNPRAHWSEELRLEFDENQFSGAVGNVLVSETDEVRVWHLSLPPGGWLTFHRHVLNYFWTTPSTGIARGYYQDGRIVDVYHYPGETRHFRHGKDEYFVHAIENVGDTELVFVTVEFLRGDNPPIPLADAVKLEHIQPALAGSD
jgi:hypothetical protein